MKKLITLIVCALSLACADGKFHTGNAIVDTGLTAATTALTGELVGIADQVAQGSDIKTAFVNGSGSALNALVLNTTGAIAPAIAAQVKQWVPPTAQWETFSHDIGTVISNYVAQHGNTNQALQTALQAAAGVLNSY